MQIAKPLKVAVVGGGVGGPTAALLLKRLGCQPVVFESAPEIAEVGAGISLAPNGFRVMKRLGLEDKLLKEAGEPIYSMHAIKPSGQTIVQFPTLAVEKYGFPMAGFRRFRLRDVLLKEMSSLDIPIELGKRLQSIKQEQGKGGSQQSPAHGAVLNFEDESCFQADLVVGCDGLRSVVRQVVRGAEDAPPR
jgi:salicylate hydroxylase